MAKALLVPGHTLEWEGAPHTAAGRRMYAYGTRGEGWAKCSCGEVSPDSMPSATQRKRWHRDVHKPAVLAAMKAHSA